MYIAHNHEPLSTPKRFQQHPDICWWYSWYIRPRHHMRVLLEGRGLSTQSTAAICHHNWTSSCLLPRISRLVAAGRLLPGPRRPRDGPRGERQRLAGNLPSLFQTRVSRQCAPCLPHSMAEQVLGNLGSLAYRLGGERFRSARVCESAGRQQNPANYGARRPPDKRAPLASAAMHGTVPRDAPMTYKYTPEAMADAIPFGCLATPAVVTQLSERPEGGGP